MELMVALLSSAALISAIYLCFVLMELSRKLGSVLKMPPYYLLFYLAGTLLTVALFARLIKASMLLVSPEARPHILYSPQFYFAAYHLPLLLGMLVALGVTIKYWGWIFWER
jgi:hypothetical protein